MRIAFYSINASNEKRADDEQLGDETIQLKMKEKKRENIYFYLYSFLSSVTRTNFITSFQFLSQLNCAHQMPYHNDSGKMKFVRGLFAALKMMKRCDSVFGLLFKWKICVP